MAEITNFLTYGVMRVQTLVSKQWVTLDNYTTGDHDDCGLFDATTFARILPFEHLNPRPVLSTLSAAVPAAKGGDVQMVVYV